MRVPPWNGARPFRDHPLCDVWRLRDGAWPRVHGDPRPSHDAREFYVQPSACLPGTIDR